MTTQSRYSLSEVDRRFAASGRRSTTRRTRRAMRRPILRATLVVLAAAAAIAALVPLVARIDLSGGATRPDARAAAAPCPIPAAFRGHFATASRRTGVPVPLLAAMAYEESRMDPVAESHAGALGLLQLMPATATELRANPLHPGANVLAGARYLKRMQQRFGRLDRALAAYNAGPSAVLRRETGSQTTAYVASVQSRARSLRRSCTG